MVLEKGKLANKNAVFLITGFVLGSSVILSPGPSACNEAWLAILCGGLAGLGLSLVFAAFLKRFPGKTFVEIAEAVLGKFLGKTVAGVYLIYLFHLGSVVMTNVLFFLKNSIYPNTPSWVLLWFMAILAVYCAWSGAEVLSRCSFVFVPLTMFLFLGTLLFIMKDIKIDNFLPLVTPLKSLAWGSLQALSFPFGETIALLMILPHLKKFDKASGIYMLGLALGGLFLLVGTIRSTGVLGPTTDAHSFPGFSVSKMIDIAGVFTRMEMITGFNFVVTSFLKITALLYGTSLGSAQLLRLRDYRFLVMPWGVLMLLFGLYNFSNIMENIEYAKYSYPIFALIIQLVFPVTIWLTAWMRGLPKAESR